MQGTTTRSTPFAELSRIGLSRAAIDRAIERHDRDSVPRLAMLWNYYRNPMEPCAPVADAGGVSGSGLRLAQERGLPGRIRGTWSHRGAAASIANDRAWTRKEIVIENDIGWRIHTMIDFMFGRPITISSTARDPDLRRTIERVLDAVWESSGGIGLLQDLGLIGHVYGSVDLIVRTLTPGMSESESRGLPSTTESYDTQTTNDTTSGATPRAETDPSGFEGGSTSVSGIDDLIRRAENGVYVEIIDPTRGVALPGRASSNATGLDAYVIRSTREADPQDAHTPAAIARQMTSALRRWWKPDERTPDADRAPSSRITTFEVFSRGLRQTYQQHTDGSITLIDESPSLVESRDGDAPPIAHIQNISQPFAYAGLSEVEPLIPLQDELNTRLSDRASRVTMLSFKMFLARGIDGAHKMPVAPGIIWSTDNPEARIDTFGGDGASPSEDLHIEQVREALDKASGVPPLASGVVRAKIGNLSSENALKITLMGLLSKTARKRITYSRGIAECCTLILDALDRMNILKTAPADRAVRIDWTDPLPRDERQALDAAVRKIELGIPRDRVLSELGYSPADPGLV